MDLPSRCGCIGPGDRLRGQTKRVGLLYYVTRLLKLGMIQQVKEFRAELHSESIVNMDILHQYYIGIRIVRTVKLISP